MAFTVVLSLVASFGPRRSDPEATMWTYSILGLQAAHLPSLTHFPYVLRMACSTIGCAQAFELSGVL